MTSVVSSCDKTTVKLSQGKLNKLTSLKKNCFPVKKYHFGLMRFDGLIFIDTYLSMMNYLDGLIHFINFHNFLLAKSFYADLHRIIYCQ